MTNGMDRWKFNTTLFSSLSDVLDITGTEIARRCGLRQQVLSRYTTNEIVVSVQILIKLCNSLRMPAYYFVAENNNFVIPNREDATIPLDYWHPIEWNIQAVEQTFGDGEGRIYWKDVAVAMEASSQKPHERFTLRRRFKVTDFLHTCSYFNISPFKFLIDENRECSKGKGRRPAVPVAPQAGNNEAVRAEVAALTKRLNGLNATVADITAKYKDLLQRHNALLERHNRMEVQFNQYFGFGTTIGKAAEPEPDET